MEFPLKSFWATPAGALRQPPAPGKVALLGFQWCCALLVFVCMSNQRAGLWGPSPAACAACNGTGGSTCTSGMGGPHGLGCPYTAFGQFQCVQCTCFAGTERHRLMCSRTPPQVPLRGGRHVVDGHCDAALVRVHRKEPAADDGTSVHQRMLSTNKLRPKRSR
jgi:hypothetical protein